MNGGAGQGHLRHVSAGDNGVAVPRRGGATAGAGMGGSFGEERRDAHRMSGGSMPGSYEEFRLDDDEEEEEEEDGESDEEGEEEEEGEYTDEEEEEEGEELEHEEFDDELLATGAMDDIPFL